MQKKKNERLDMLVQLQLSPTCYAIGDVLLLRILLLCQLVL